MLVFALRGNRECLTTISDSLSLSIRGCCLTADRGMPHLSQ
ncbi:unnamed protein product, partial [marine sediment metagenome]